MLQEKQSEGLRALSGEIVHEYDKGGLDARAARRLLFTVRRFASLSGGTEEDALQGICRGGAEERCGLCLKKCKTKTLDELTTFFEQRLFFHMNNEEDPLAHDSLCRDCWSMLLAEWS